MTGTKRVILTHIFMVHFDTIRVPILYLYFILSQIPETPFSI